MLILIWICMQLCSNRAFVRMQMYVKIVGWKNILFIASFDNLQLLGSNPSPCGPFTGSVGAEENNENRN